MSFVDDFFGVRDAVRTIAVSPYPRKDHGATRFSEFVSLCHAADLEVVGVKAAPIREPHPGTLFRQGHIDRIRTSAEALAADLVAVDADLTPVQQRGLEEALGLGVLDRTAIILTIFGRRAKSSEGKLQVALAQHEFVLPRLVGMWHHFDRERGGIGLRGAGEKQIEIDRRLVRTKIAQIKKDLKTIERTRDLHRAKRRRSAILQVAVVGYTNVGKSTLLRLLSNRSVFVRDMPFATLDPLTRRVELADGTKFLLTDTVGFVQDLPHSLIEAFKSTLEETLEADAIIHLVDASAPEPWLQVETTNEVLQELGMDDRPMLYVLNKIDQTRTDPTDVPELMHLQPQVQTSILHHQGIDGILDWVRSIDRRRRDTVRVRIPLSRPDLIEIAERRSDRPGRWGTANVEYEVPSDSELAQDQALRIS